MLIGVKLKRLKRIGDGRFNLCNEWRRVMSEDREHFIWQNNVHVDFKGNEIWINLVVNRWFIFLDIKNSKMTYKIMIFLA